jgi:hypothetical protein
VAVPSLDESLGLEVNTSDEELEECVNDEHPDIELAEDSGSSNDLENEPSSPIIPKSTIPPSRAPSRKLESIGVEESVTGKLSRGYRIQLELKLCQNPKVRANCLQSRASGKHRN